MYFHVRFQNALKINKRPIFSQKASIVVRTQSSFDGSTLDDDQKRNSFPHPGATACLQSSRVELSSVEFS